MLSAHISSRILSVFIASYPHGKTHQEGNEAAKKTKSISLISYQEATIGRVNERILNCPRISGSSSGPSVSDWLTDWAADIKHYWISAKTWTAGFWNLIQLMKATLKIGGGSASNVSNLWAEMNLFFLFLTGHWSISPAIKEKRPWTEIKEDPTKSKTFKYVSGSSNLSPRWNLNLTYNRIQREITPWF